MRPFYENLCKTGENKVPLFFLIKAILWLLWPFEKQHFFLKILKKSGASPTWFHPEIWVNFFFFVEFIYKNPGKNPQNPWPSSFKFWRDNLRNRHISDHLPPEYC